MARMGLWLLIVIGGLLLAALFVVLRRGKQSEARGHFALQYATPKTTLGVVPSRFDAALPVREEDIDQLSVPATAWIHHALSHDLNGMRARWLDAVRQASGAGTLNDELIAYYSGIGFSELIPWLTAEVDRADDPAVVDVLCRALANTSSELAVVETLAAEGAPDICIGAWLAGEPSLARYRVSDRVRAAVERLEAVDAFAAAKAYRRIEGSARSVDINDALEQHGNTQAMLEAEFGRDRVVAALEAQAIDGNDWLALRKLAQVDRT